VSFTWSGACTSSDWVVAAFFLGAGTTAILSARSEAGIGKAIYAIAGAVFVVAGTWMTVSQVACRAPLPDARALVGPLAWKWSTGSWITLAIALVLSQLTFGIRPFVRARLFAAAAWVAFAVTAAQFRTFGTGAMAARWYLVSLLVMVTATVVRARRPDLAEPDGPAVSLSL
jgi:hypothetical protein